MDYFRQKLLTYSTDRQISNLLHIYVETDKARLLVPPSRAKNYVDQVLNQYTVKMYQYPELSNSDSKLALSIYNKKQTIKQAQKDGRQAKEFKQHKDPKQKDLGNVFQIDEIKRKPLKKKIIKKAVVLPALAVSNEDQINYKICQCCNAKVVNKHRCEHAYCEKPCMRIKRQKQFSNRNEQQSMQNKKKSNGEQQQFSPQVENDQSKYSKSDMESDYQQQIGMISEMQDSQSFNSSASKMKRGDRRKIKKRRIKKQAHSKNRRSQGHRNGQKRSNPRQNSKTNNQQQYQYQNNAKNLRIKNQVSQQVVKTDNLQKIQSTEERINQNGRPELQQKISQKSFKDLGASGLKLKGRKSGKNKQKKRPSQQNIESQFQPIEQHGVLPRKQSKKKRSSLNKKGSLQQSEKDSLHNCQANNQNQNIEGSKSKKKSSILNYCSIQQLKVNSLFQIKIVDNLQNRQIRTDMKKAIDGKTQKQGGKNSKTEKGKKDSFIQEEQRQDIASNKGKNRILRQQKQNKVETIQNSVLHEQVPEAQQAMDQQKQPQLDQVQQMEAQRQYMEEPIVDALLDPLSNQEIEDDLLFAENINRQGPKKQLE